MGHISTQERFLESSQPVTCTRWFWDSPSKTIPKVIDPYGWSPSLTAPRQMTTSYRSKSERNRAEDDLTIDDLREFADVTRNGLTEPNPEFDNGHEFFTSKCSLTSSHPNWDYSWQDPRSTNFRYRQKGPLFLNVSNEVVYGGMGTPYVKLDRYKLSANDARVKGAKFIADTIPTKGPAQLATVIGEAYAGLPSLIGMQMMKNRGGPILKDLGGEALNYEFGIMPTISDTKELMAAVAKTSKIIQQYHRDSGRRVRRHRSLPLEKHTTVVPTVLNSGDIVGWDNGAVETRNPVNLTQTVKTKTWFSGAYIYYLNDDPDGVISRFKKFEEDANRVLGSRLTLDVLWQLAPWSWLLDWVANIGDIITNATYIGQDGLVLQYGYLMNHVKMHETYSMPLGATFKGGAKTGPITNSLRLESKERVRATPYGFGFLLDGLNVKQWAILGALGLTKAPKSLF